jgi:hypothetical protein
MPAAGYGSFAADRIAPRGCRPRASALGYLSQLPELTRRFPPPWTVEETDACFIVRDTNGEALALGMHGARRFSRVQRVAEGLRLGLPTVFGASELACGFDPSLGIGSRSKSGSFAMLAAIRRASSRVRRCAAALAISLDHLVGEEAKQPLGSALQSCNG